MFQLVEVPLLVPLHDGELSVEDVHQGARAGIAVTSRGGPAAGIRGVVGGGLWREAGGVRFTFDLQGTPLVRVTPGGGVS